MRRSDLDWVAHIIRTSGIGNKPQREAIILRLRDQFDARKVSQAQQVAYLREIKRELQSQFTDED